MVAPSLESRVQGFGYIQYKDDFGEMVAPGLA